MKNALREIYLFCVGPAYGFKGYGTSQWNYTIAMAINIMLVWRMKPQIAIFFTVMAAIHYATVVVYGYYDMDLEDEKYTLVYSGIHLVLILLSLIVNYKWTMLTCAIVIIGFLLSSDECRYIIGIKTKKEDELVPLIINTLVMIAFVVVDFSMPIAAWIKVSILLLALLLHPFIDGIEVSCDGISGVTSSIVENLMDFYQDRKHR